MKNTVQHQLLFAFPNRELRAFSPGHILMRAACSLGGHEPHITTIDRAVGRQLCPGQAKDRGGNVRGHGNFCDHLAKGTELETAEDSVFFRCRNLLVQSSSLFGGSAIVSQQINQRVGRYA